MELHKKNFVKMSLSFYTFARNASKLQSLLQKRGGDDQIEICNHGDSTAVGYDMREIYAKIEELYGSNLIFAATSMAEPCELQAHTVEDGEPFYFEMALRCDISVVVLTKDRMPFGEKIDQIVKMVREMLLDVGDSSGAVVGELTIDGETELVELSGDSLTKCDETFGERKARQEERRRMAQSDSSDGFSSFLASLLGL